MIAFSLVIAGALMIESPVGLVMVLLGVICGAASHTT